MSSLRPARRIYVYRVQRRRPDSYETTPTPTFARPALGSRILQRLQLGGDAALVHGLRGQPSNHRKNAKLRRRGQEMVLLHMIDDATSHVLARFYDANTVLNHMDLRRRWLQAFGRPFHPGVEDSLPNERNDSGHFYFNQPEDISIAFRECRTRFEILKTYAACLCSVSSWQRVALPGRSLMNVRKRLSSLSTAARNCKIASAPSGSSQNFSVPLTR